MLHILKRYCDRSPNTLKASVFIDTTKLNAFPSLREYFAQKHFSVEFFHIDAEVSVYEEKFLYQCKNDLEKFDILWSDNLIFPLKYHNKVFLTGSFLWADVYEEFTKEYELLRRKKPIMIGNKYFATDGVKNHTAFYGVGIYDYSSLRKPKRLLPNVLLSCGTTNEAKKYLSEHFPRVRNMIKRSPHHIKVFLEPQFYEDLKTEFNVSRATFDEEMFSSISAAVIRPGLGSICEVLLKGGRIFAFGEDNNAELEHNAKVLQRLHVGEKCHNVAEAFERALNYLDNEQQQKAHLSYLDDLDFHGINQTVEKIEEITNAL